MPGKRILIAEDEADARFTLELIVERLGHQPTAAADGAKALELLMLNHRDNTPFDLLLCDIQMPALNGEELIHLMRQSDIETPVLIITGYGDRQLMHKLVESGCREFIEKPFLPDELERKIESILDTDEPTETLP